MKNIYIIISLFFVVFNGCNRIAINYEQNAYLDIIPFLIDIDNYYKPAPPPTLILKDSTEQKLYIQSMVYDSVLNDYNLLKDTISKFLIINDTLKSLDVETIISSLNQYNEYLSIIQNIQEQENSEARLVIEKIQGTNNVKLITDDLINGKSLHESIGFIEDKLYIGYITLSRILFNDVNTKGVLVYNFFCSKKCGETTLVLIERSNDKWVIKERIILDII